MTGCGSARQPNKFVLLRAELHAQLSRVYPWEVNQAGGLGVDAARGAAACDVAVFVLILLCCILLKRTILVEKILKGTKNLSGKKKKTN